MLTSCQTHQRILVEAPAFEGQTQEIQLMPYQKTTKADVPQKKRVAPLESLTPKLISRAVPVFRCDFSFGAGLKSASIQIEAFLEKLQPSYTF